MWLFHSYCFCSLFFRFYRSKKMPQNAMAWYWCSSIWESRQRCCKTFYWSLEFYEGVIMGGKFVLHFCIRRERQTFFPFLFKLCHHLMPLNLASKLICLRNNFYIVLPTPQFTHFYFSMMLTVCYCLCLFYHWLSVHLYSNACSALSFYSCRNALFRFNHYYY